MTMTSVIKRVSVAPFLAAAVFFSGTVDAVTIRGTVSSLVRRDPATGAPVQDAIADTTVTALDPNSLTPLTDAAGNPFQAVTGAGGAFALTVPDTAIAPFAFRLALSFENQSRVDVVLRDINGFVGTNALQVIQPEVTCPPAVHYHPTVYVPVHRHHVGKLRIFHQH
jgi:hypothetical protein